MFAYCMNNPVMFSDPTGYSVSIAAVVLVVAFVVFAVAAVGISHYVSKHHPDGYRGKPLFKKEVSDNCNFTGDLGFSDSTGPGIDKNGAALGETDSAVFSFALRDKDETGMLKLDVLSLDGALSVDYSGGLGFDVGLSASVLSVKVEQEIGLGTMSITPGCNVEVLTISGGIAWDPEEGKVKGTAPSAGWISGGGGIDVDHK